MKLTERQADLGIELMDAAEQIPTGFMWFEYHPECGEELFTRTDIKNLKQMKKETDRAYIRFMKAIGEKV